MISIIICTYNRAESLGKTLNSLLVQDYCNTFDYEILIVDNNSKDRTKEVVESYRLKFKDKLKYVFEQNQGLSYARNTGINESMGQIIAFTDDDVIVSQDWVSTIQAPFIQLNADCVFGRILPTWPISKPPSWLRRDSRLWINLALLDYGDKLKVATSPKEQFFGANFAIRRDAFLAASGKFNINLGRKGSQLYAGEDTELFLRLLNLGKKIVYNPDCLVHHKVESNRLTKRYFRRWHYFAGSSFSYMHAVDHNIRTRTIFRVPLWFVRGFIGHLLKLVKFTLMLNVKDGFRMQLICLYDLGAMNGFMKKKGLCQK